MPAPLRVIHETDPKQDIINDVKDLVHGFRPMADRVLLVMYERGKQNSTGEVRTKGGLIIPNVKAGSLNEDQYQGKVGLVVAIGDLAFEEDADHKWGARPQVGDWVMIQVGNSSSFDIPGPRRARMVRDVQIEMIVSDENIGDIY